MTHPPDSALTPSRSRPGQRASPLFLLLGIGHLALVWRIGAWMTPDQLPVVSAMLAFAVAVGLAHASLLRRYPHQRLGACNAVTQLRAALACCLVVPILAPEVMAHPSLDWALIGLALVALALDGVDGWLARRSGLVSDFGARFDMEVDAALALLLAIAVLRLDKAGSWVLVLGAMRYAFVVAQIFLPWLGGTLPERFSRKVVCVVQIGVLILLLMPWMTPPLSPVLAAVASVALIWSFGRDIRWLAARR